MSPGIARPPSTPREWAERGGQRSIHKVGPPLRLIEQTALLAAEFVHSFADSVELFTQPCRFVLQHLKFLLPARRLVGWAILPGRRDIPIWKPLAPRPARQPRSMVPVSPSPATTAVARAIAAPASSTHPATTPAIIAAAWPRVCPTRRVPTGAVPHTPACPGTHACGSTSISCWHLVHLHSILIDSTGDGTLTNHQY